MVKAYLAFKRFSQLKAVHIIIAIAKYCPLLHGYRGLSSCDQGYVVYKKSLVVTDFGKTRLLRTKINIEKYVGLIHYYLLFKV